MNHRNKPSGFTLTELVVAATLMVAVMAVMAPLTVRSGRLWRDTRHQQLALEELSNQLELLTALNPKEREAALEQLAPSDHLEAALPGATITSELIRDGDGARLVLNLSWKQQTVQPQAVPITLVGWLDPMPRESQSAEATP